MFSTLIAILSTAVSILSLNGTWDVALCDEKPAEFSSTVQVPGVITQAQPSLGENLDALDSEVNYDYVWYRTTFWLEEKQFPRAVLYLRARYNAEVWINGCRIGYDANCSYSHAEFDISEALRYNGSNELLVKVGSWNTASSASKENEAEWWRSTRVPGIWDDAYICFENKPAIRHMQLIPELDKEIVTARVCLRTSPGEKSTVCAEILDGETVVSRKEVVMTNTDLYELSVPAGMLTRWTPGKEGNPKLYSLRMRIYAKGELVAEKTERFGYRSICTSGRDVLLNGEKIIFRADNIAFVRALNRWADGLFNPEWLRNFIRTAVQEYNLNFVRVHLGHASTLFYDIADEEGLLIEDEWRFMHDEEPVGRDWEDTYTEFQRWILENCNHPSIIAWDQENEGNVKLSGMIREFRILDPTRLWSEQDFNAKHVYDYSEQLISDFSKVEIPQDKPYTVLESCRFWTNEYGNLEKREAFKTSRTASGWNLYCYTIEDIAMLLSDLHSDIGTFYRSQRIQAWSPFALLSGKVNGHNYFQGNILDSLTPQQNLLQLKRLNEPVGSSIKMTQAREWFKDRKFYGCGSSFTAEVLSWNDFSEEETAELSLELRDTDGNSVGTWCRDIRIAPFGCTSTKIDIRFPAVAGVYFLVPELKFADGNTVEGVIRRYMVADKTPEDGYMAFGGRREMTEGAYSIFENFIGSELDPSLLAKLTVISDGALVDEFKAGKKNGWILKTSRFDDSGKATKTEYKLSEDGEIIEVKNNIKQTNIHQQ